MVENDLLQQAIEHFWDTVPPVWGRVRGFARSLAVEEFDLTLVQFHILRHIRHGAHTVAELAERQQISRPAISQGVELLVEKGLVSRCEDVQDRRYVQLELTEKGNNLLSQVFAHNRQWMAEKMASLTPGELQTVISAMSILKSAFDPQKE